jgi:hypothetical protein
MTRRALLGAAAVLLAACAPDGSEAPLPYAPGPGDAWETRTPEELGMDAAKLQEAID